VGSGAGYNQVTISDGGQIRGLQTVIGSQAAAPNNDMLITGSGSMLSNDLALYVGLNSSGNRLTITNGGKASSTQGIIGNSAGSTNNVVVVTGVDSVWEARTTADFHVGITGSNNTLIVRDGGLVTTPATIFLGGGAGANNQVIVTNGGIIRSIQTLLGNVAASTGNKAIVTGADSVWTNSTFHFYVGHAGGSNSLIVSDGGQLYNQQGRVGNLATSLGNSVLVTGPGSLWQNNSALYVGNNGVTLGEGHVLVTDGGTIESPEWRSGSLGSGTISNQGGIYQFATPTPTIVTNTFGSIVVTNGAISYRNVASADIFNANVARITFAGDNTFMLKNSSNATGLASYTFDSVANTGAATNYQRLALVDNSTWRSANLNIGSGGALLVSNGVSAVDAAFVSSGSVLVVNSKLTFASNVVINGSYISDPSTNTYLADVTVNPSGSLAGGVGDLFDFRKSLFIQSTNSVAFKLESGSVVFSGGVLHTNSITGVDLGGDNAAHEAAFAFGTNFAYGQLHLESVADLICFLSGNGAASNALYVGWLDLLDSTDNVANLIAGANINVYYAIDDTRNAYLGGQTYQLLDHLGGAGGFLLPVIPEPSAVLLLGYAALIGLRRRHRS
jgi:T5SS/PEP-CTERM-associated repeat protein